MKINEILPKEMIEKYQISISDGMLHIQNPTYVGVVINENFKVAENDTVFTINNGNAAISLWKERVITHTTIF